VLGWIIMDLIIRQAGWKRVTRHALLLVAGWLAVAGPYMATLYVQAHESPLKQTFRQGRYQVTVSDPSILAAIAQNDIKPTDSYSDLYRKRRLQRQLLPDASEMHAYAIRDKNPLNTSPAVETLVAKLTRPGEIAQNLVDNVRHLASLAGSHVLVVFLISVLSALTVPSSVTSRWARLLLPALVGIYIFILSLMTGLIERYLAVLLPLIAIHIGIELGVFVSWWKNKYPATFLLPAIVMIGLAASLLTAPRTLLNASMLPPGSGLQRLVPSSAIPDREPVFVLLPFYSYMAGGSYRLLPNDSLERVIHYGRLTGVRWLMVPAVPRGELLGEISLYSRARWLMNPEKLRKCKRLLKLHGTLNVFGDEHLLFELPASPDPRQGAAPDGCGK